MPDSLPAAAGDSHVRLLLELDRLHIEPDRIPGIRALAGDPELNWGAFIDLAARHRLLPLAGRHVHRHRLDRRVEDGALAFPYPWLFASAYLGNRHRNQALYDEFGPLLADLTAAGVPYAVRKGFALVEAVYHDAGVRRINDLDLLVDRGDAPRVHEVLQRYGYEQGQLAVDGDRIEPFDKATQMAWRMRMNNQLPYRKAGHRPDVSDYNVDLCHGIFPRSTQTDATVGDLLARARPAVLCGAPSLVLEPADFLLDLCAHLYKEATSAAFVREGLDLQLSKFLDVSLFGASLDDAAWDRFTERALGYGVGASVYYALHFTTALHPGAIPERVLDGLRPENLDYLDGFGVPEGQDGRWSQDFIARLFDPGRSREAGAAEPGPTQAVLSARYHA
jgi:Uncharacterised nucleotidyltransferase